ncbi:MAG: hypothetical protein QNJ46_24640 [Leptolyngbyaceae cyanobacterium MO_188.B28]|nr:hypothetical protein [Leptolyngbyaceae cyanobacterium MO_188.B28]
MLIAHALALKLRSLLFDEVASALDTHTQSIVSQSIEQLQLTRIAIAHRRRTIRHADRTYVTKRIGLCNRTGLRNCHLGSYIYFQYSLLVYWNVIMRLAGSCY